MPALGSIEDAGAVGETAIRIGQSLDLQGLRIEDAHLLNCLGDFLAVGANILHRRSAHGSGNATQTFHTRTTSIDRLSN